MQDLERRPGGVGGRTAADVANQMDPGRKTLVEALDSTLAAAPGSAVDTAATSAPSDQQSALVANTPGADAAASATGPLSPAQVAAAIQFHTVQSWKYSKAVIADIQNAVGVTSTGVMDTATVQAIARRQAAVNAERQPNPELKVDGKAGPRTLPILRPVGLATDEAIDTYTSDVRGMSAELGAATREERAKSLLKEINKLFESNLLGDVKIPPIKNADEPKFHPREGQFDHTTWTMTIAERTLDNVNVTAALMYHEARHAEQKFRIARMLAGRKYSVAGIVAETKIEVSVATEAKNALPLAPRTTEAVEAEGWHEDEPGMAQKRAATRAARDRFVVSGRAFKQDRENAAKRQQAEADFAAFNQAMVHSYRDKPEEFDAFFLGDKVSDKLNAPRDVPITFDEAIDLL